MKKQIRISISGQNTIVADFLVNRLLPNDQIIKVGPFVFLDHLYPKLHKGQTPEAYSGQNAHPHRGIATFSYVLSGELQHFDSRNHQGIVEEGGAQWMKAGSGIVHDERPGPRFQREGGILHSLQFWINLPASVKSEAPDYAILSPRDIGSGPKSVD